MEAVQNSVRSTKIGGVTGAGFKPGVSGNPGGRPKGAARTVREVCGGSPLRLAQGLLEIAEDPKARHRDRLAAYQELLDRGWGRPPAFAAVEGHDPLEVDELTAEAQRFLAEITARGEDRVTRRRLLSGAPYCRRWRASAQIDRLPPRKRGREPASRLPYLKSTIRWERGPMIRAGQFDYAWLTREESGMAYGIVHFFPGGTEEQYEASIAEVHPSRDRLPEGQTFHAAGPSDGGWTVVAVHESKESWETFRDGILMPRMQAGIEGGFPTPPQETAFEVRNLQQ